MSRKRLAALPDVPTFEELGFKDLEVTAWEGLFVPKGTPPDIVARLSGELSKALSTPEVRRGWKSSA
jgi:tripartite-type tricarboxylate transporter receptor subunit TctC